MKFTPAKVTKGDQTEVTASWEAVEGAASYDVSFNGGASENVTGTSYTIAAATVAALAAGEYTISVGRQPRRRFGAGLRYRYGQTDRCRGFDSGRRRLRMGFLLAGFQRPDCTPHGGGFHRSDRPRRDDRRPADFLRRIAFPWRNEQRRQLYPDRRQRHGFGSQFFVHGFRFWQVEGRGFEYRQQCRYGRACRDGSDR